MKNKWVKLILAIAVFMMLIAGGFVATGMMQPKEDGTHIEVNVDEDAVDFSVMRTTEAPIRGKDRSLATEIGVMVLLDAPDSETYQWRLLENGADLITIEGGTRAVFAAREEGSYTICLATSIEGQVSLDLITITVGQPADDLVGWVEFKVKQYQFNQQVGLRLSKGFESAVSKVESGEIITVQQFLKYTTEVNQLVTDEAIYPNVKKFLVELAGKFNAMNMSPDDLDAHVAAWRQVIAGIRGAYTEDVDVDVDVDINIDPLLPVVKEKRQDDEASEVVNS